MLHSVRPVEKWLLGEDIATVLKTLPGTTIALRSRHNWDIFIDDFKLKVHQYDHFQSYPPNFYFFNVAQFMNK